MPVSAPSRASTPPGHPTRPRRGHGFQEALQRVEQGRAAHPRALHRHARPVPHSRSRRPGEAQPSDPATPATAQPTTSARASQGPPPGIPELQAAVRAAPPAIAAAVAASSGNGPPQLALGFGGALSVELRAGAQGVELSLRPAPQLERAARAELPRLVEALRARGVRVTRADVKPRAPARAR